MTLSPEFTKIDLNGNYKVSTNSSGKIENALLINKKNKTGSEYWYNYRYGKYSYSQVINWKDGLMHGDATYYDYNGRMHTKKIYNEGLIVTHEKYNRDGRLIYTANYKNNKLDGKVYDYLIYGGVSIVYTESNYDNGLLHGKQYIRCDRTGLLAVESNFKNGKLDGDQYDYFTFSQDGKTFKLSKTASYANGKLHGKVTNYNLSGTIDSEINYYKGSQCGYQYKTENNKIIEKFIFCRKNLLADIKDVIADYKLPIDDVTYNYLKLKYK